ncbi:MAG: hypothetical protein JWL95_1452 [Gemmatimonadetes bacterium]|nr:hypothetical protein [Gemmatimonadota bacterium]
MSEIDEDEVARVMKVLPEVLAHEELVVQRTLPRLSAADALDTALKRSLVRLRFELNQDSFEYLRWKVTMARAETQRLRAAAALTQENAQITAAQSQSMRDHPGSTPRNFRTRTFRNEHDIVWTVSALNTLTPTDPRHSTCLVFSSEESVVCVWEFPDDWCDLSDAELDELRRQR